MDLERINARLSSLNSYISRLSKIAPKGQEAYEKSEPNNKAAIERYLQVISEIEIDILALIYKEKNLDIAGSEKSMLESLEKIFGRSFIDKVKKRRELRNELVHAYANIDDKEVFNLASNLSDLEEFKKSVTKIIKT